MIYAFAMKTDECYTNPRPLNDQEYAFNIVIQHQDGMSLLSAYWPLESTAEASAVYNARRCSAGGPRVNMQRSEK